MISHLLRLFDRTKKPVQKRYGAFHGADVSRLTESWFASIQSADEEIKADAYRLRGRARSLVRDNPHAAGYIEDLATNVVGADGVQLQSRVKTTRGELNKTLNAAIELDWRRWSMPGQCTTDGYESFVDLQSRVMSQMAMDGEVFLQQHLNWAGNEWRYALEWVDPDLVDYTYTVMENGRPPIVMGIELDAYGRPVAYHRWRYHPQNTANNATNYRLRVPAAQMIHLFRRYRIDQHRGIPAFTPVLMRLRMLDGYEESELVASRISASKMGFFVSTGDEPAPYGTSDAQGDGVTTPGRVRMDAEPGLLEQLPHGMEFQSWNPDHPSTAFEQFERAMLRAMARGLGVSYATFTGDLSDVNYSSIRAGLLTERDGYRRMQKWLIDHLLRPVYLNWLRNASLTNMVAVTDPRTVAESALWKPRGFAWVDPLKEIQAAKLEIELGLNSRTTVAARQGIDYLDNLKVLADEMKAAEEAGVDVSGSQGDSASLPPDDDETNADDKTPGRVLPLRASGGKP